MCPLSVSPVPVPEVWGPLPGTAGSRLMAHLAGLALSPEPPPQSSNASSRLSALRWFQVSVGEPAWACEVWLTHIEWVPARPWGIVSFEMSS